MAKIDFNAVLNKAPSDSKYANKNKKILLEDGTYEAIILYISELQSKGKGNAITLRFGILDLDKGGIYTTIDHDFFLKHDSINFLETHLNQVNKFISELDIPNIFDDEIGVSSNDKPYLFMRKLKIQVTISDEKFKDKTTGRDIEYKKNKIIGFSSQGTIKSDNSPRETMSKSAVQKGNEDNIPSYAQDDGSFDSLEVF